MSTPTAIDEKLHRLFLVAALGMPLLGLTVMAAKGMCANDLPIHESRIMSTGGLWLSVSNFLTLGSGPQLESQQIPYLLPEPEEDMRSLQINWQPSLEFPAGSRRNYLFVSAIAVGALVGLDTLVSTSYGVVLPFNREFLSYKRLHVSSNEPSGQAFDLSALAPNQLESVSSDTTSWLTQYEFDELDYRGHRPLGIECRERVLGWDEGLSKQVVVVDVTVRNISHNVLLNPAIGLLVIPKIGHLDVAHEMGSDGICGIIRQSLSEIVETRDSAFMVWMAAVDGNPTDGRFGRESTVAVLGCEILRPLCDECLSFNWWIWTDWNTGQTWGPARLGSRVADYGSNGRPGGDRGLYYMMRNHEVDYDQVTAAMSHLADGWNPPLSNGALMTDISNGGHISLLLSVSLREPILPKDSMVFTFSMLMGDRLHKDPYNFQSNFTPSSPSKYLQSLDFSDLQKSSTWARWLFDTPGVDTDGNGYSGEYHLTNCVAGRCDTIWYRGDGVPDWGGPQAPPAPRFEPTTRPNAVTLRWTGEFSEIAEDHFSRRRDFEGYRVYSSRTNTEGEYALIASWDIPDNYRRFAYDDVAGKWGQISYPLTTPDWRKELGDFDFDPRDYAHPSLAYAYRDTVSDTIKDDSGNVVQVVVRERLSYWAPEGPNHGNTYPDGGEVYENHIQRVDIRDTVIGEDTLQYGIYEMTLDDLNAAIPLWFAVTAFDHGDYRRNLESLEGNPNANAQFAFPQYSADVVVDSGLNVTVYPNPYKILFADVHGNQTNYFAQGYEAYGQTVMDERERRIWFANLPDTATIRIYSLDGDLIREIHHPDKHLTRYSSIVGWDLISRNTQAVTSGIYIWRVDSRLGSQVGKIVIIK